MLSKAFSGKWLMTLYLCKEESCKWKHKNDKLYAENKELGEKILCSVAQGYFKETLLVCLLSDKQKSLMKASIL